MKVLLDTHAFLWFVWNDTRLAANARLHIEDPTNDLFLSAASAWEMAIKIGIGKLSVGQELEAFLTEQMTNNRIALLPLSIAHAAKVAALPHHHKDPFDRLLIAQSLTEHMPLIGRDDVFDRYGVTRHW